MTRTKVLLVYVGVCTLLIAYLTWKVLTVARQQHQDEMATCIIQAHGLPANKQLAASLKDIHILLLLPRAPGAKTPPIKVERLIVDLDSHLAAYQALEAKQPRTRHC